jgi:outer membrane protein assembly factor BamB
MNFVVKALLFQLLIYLNFSAHGQSNYYKQWPQFRGTFASGIMDSSNLPDHWDIETFKNVKWKIDIPGLGHSSPVVWDEKVYITTAISSSGKDSLKIGLYGSGDAVNDTSEHEFRVYCINKFTGEKLWEHLAHKGVPKTKRHPKSSHANPTPATNGEYVVAFFGSEGLYCYSMEGDLIWQKEFGKMNAGPYDAPDLEWGFSSSPIIHENRVIIECDFLGESFISLLDLKTGNEIWRTHRDDVSTWSTPNFYKSDSLKHIIVNGWKHMGAYDFETGKEIWKLSGGGDIPIPTPIFAHGLIYIHNAHGRYSPIYAIDPKAEGDITLGSDSISNEYIKWSVKRGGAYMPTILIYEDLLYNLRINGILMCFNAKTGNLIYNEMIPGAVGGISASGICSDGKLYYSTERGDVFIVKTGEEFELIAKNSLNDLIMATPAISENMLIFRTSHHLIAISNQENELTD